jgi:hypothetical protein
MHAGEERHFGAKGALAQGAEGQGGKRRRSSDRGDAGALRRRRRSRADSGAGKAALEERDRRERQSLAVRAAYRYGDSGAGAG